MAAATVDRDGEKSEGRVKALEVKGATKLFKNTLAGWNAGFLQPMAHGTSGLRFAGVTQHKADNSAGADGDIKCKVDRHGEWSFVYNGGNADETLLGKTAYAVSDQEVDEDQATVTNEYAVGVITGVESPTVVRVQIDGYCLRAAPAAQAAIASLTDNSGGAAADGTIGAITTGGNVGADVPAAIKELATKTNEIIATLRSAGIIAQ